MSWDGWDRSGQSLCKHFRRSVEALGALGPQIQWIQSYVTENKVYCIYLAPDEATIREHAQRVGIPANRVAAVRRMMTVLDAGT